MDDLELLQALPGPIESPDVETKARVRAVVEARIAPTPARRPRRPLKAGRLMIAAVLAAASVAAGIAVHPWSDDEPVALEGIDNPNGQIATPADLESVVAEFAPAIRLPEDGSFDVWIQRQVTNPTSSFGGGLVRADVVHSMVFVSQCQWGQAWLDASADGDQARAGQALRVLGGVSDWLRSTGMGDSFGTVGLLDRMQSGDLVGVQLIENGCGYTGSWGTTQAQQDAKAMSDLSPAIQAAQSYLRNGGNPAAFDPSTGAALEPSISWTWSHFQPAPASPGFVFIAPSPGAAVTLVTVSEVGTQFCAVVTDTQVQHGTTTDDLTTVEDAEGAVNAKYPGPVSCMAGGW